MNEKTTIIPPNADTDEEPGLDVFHRYLDYKMGKGCVSEKEQKLFLDYESIKKKEKTLDDIDEWTMVQIYQLLYHEMSWISENKKKQPEN